MNRIALLLGLALLATACGVRKDIHQAALDTIAGQEGDLNQFKVRMYDLEEERDRLESDLKSAKERLEKVTRSHDRLLTENGALRDRLSELGQDVDRLTEETGELAANLEEARQALAELRQRQEAFEQAERNLRAIQDKLRELIEAGTLSVRLERGRVIINLRQDILFGSGSAELSKGGITAIAEVAAALSGFSDRNFQVEGHTDNVAIKTARFPSNWELSSARAMAVVHVLVDGGMPASHLSGAGFGEHWPASSNDTDEGRKLNRRIEIVMLPDLGALLGD